MKIEASKKGDICIISVEGRVDSKSVPDFEKGILEIADRGGHKFRTPDLTQELVSQFCKPV